jgi:hypothetical protein
MKKFNVKRFKIIVNCVIAVLFIVSLSFNVFIMSVLELNDAASFRQTVLAKELLNERCQGNCCVEEEPNDILVENDIEESEKPEDVVEESETPVEKDDSIRPVIPPLYQDENVKITYLNKVDSTFGLAYEFEIENTGDKPVTVEFSDIYIDGFKVELSELTCKSLVVGEKATGVFTLVQSEWETFTVAPSKVEFRITLINPKSLLIRYESDRITFDIK